MSDQRPAVPRSEQRTREDDAVKRNVVLRHELVQLNLGSEVSGRSAGGQREVAADNWNTNFPTSLSTALTEAVIE